MSKDDIFNHITGIGKITGKKNLKVSALSYTSNNSLEKTKDKAQIAAKK